MACSHFGPHTGPEEIYLLQNSDTVAFLAAYCHSGLNTGCNPAMDTEEASDTLGSIVHPD